MFLRHPYLVILLLATALPAGAETYQTCKGFIDTVPATISTQGVWCLRKDLSTAIGQGAAITIAAGNVTIDCNGFKLGGLAAGDGSLANGIHSQDVFDTVLRVFDNTTVRRCNIRGYRKGIFLDSGNHHLIEDNRLDNNLEYGILIPSSNAHNLVQRNRVYDTGGAVLVPKVVGISASADIIDNVVSSVFNTTSSMEAIGIEAPGGPLEIRGNRISRLAVEFGGEATGIKLGYTRNLVRDNYIHSFNPINGSGITPTAYCLDNVVFNFSTPAYNCEAPPAL